MHRSIFALTFAIAVLVAGAGCERHSFEQTKALHQDHGSHGHTDSDSSDHKGDHAKPHGDKAHKDEKKGGEKSEPKKGQPRNLGF